VQKHAKTANTEPEVYKNMLKQLPQNQKCTKHVKNMLKQLPQNQKCTKHANTATVAYPPVTTSGKSGHHDVPYRQ